MKHTTADVEARFEVLSDWQDDTASRRAEYEYGMGLQALAEEDPDAAWELLDEVVACDLPACSFCGHVGTPDVDLWTSHHADGDSYSCRDAHECRWRMKKVIQDLRAKVSRLMP